MDILWNVPQSHGTVGWDGHFTAFLDTYGSFYLVSPLAVLIRIHP